MSLTPVNVEAVSQIQDYTAGENLVYQRGVFGNTLGMDWRQALIARSKGWQASVGTFSTPIVGGGNGTVIDADQPELVVDVPSGTTMIPLRCEVSLLLPLIASDNDEVDIVIAVDGDAVSGATGTNGTVEAPRNLRTNKAGGCPCTVVSAVTTNLSAAPTLDLELSHYQLHGDVQGTAANAYFGNGQHLYEPRFSPFILGPATFIVYFGGTVATSGFISLDFLAIDSAELTNLTK